MDFSCSAFIYSETHPCPLLLIMKAPDTRHDSLPESNGGLLLRWNDCLYEVLLLLRFPISAWFQLFQTYTRYVCDPQGALDILNTMYQRSCCDHIKPLLHSMPDVTYDNDFYVHRSHAWHIWLSMINAGPLLARLIFFILWFLSWKNSCQCSLFYHGFARRYMPCQQLYSLGINTALTSAHHLFSNKMAPWMVLSTHNWFLSSAINADVVTASLHCFLALVLLSR